MITNIQCPHDRRITLTLDTSEVFPSDPGNGTPAMIYFKQGSTKYSATYNCVMDTGEIENYEVTDRVYTWLDNMADAVDDCIDAGTFAKERAA